MDINSEDITRLINALIKIAPGAGFLIVAAVCFRISGDTLGGVLQGIASLLWGWKKRNGK
jgi:hypothetical protein